MSLFFRLFVFLASAFVSAFIATAQTGFQVSLSYDSIYQKVGVNAGILFPSNPSRFAMDVNYLFTDKGVTIFDAGITGRDIYFTDAAKIHKFKKQFRISWAMRAGIRITKLDMYKDAFWNPYLGFGVSLISEIKPTIKLFFDIVPMIVFGEHYDEAGVYIGVGWMVN